MAFITDIKRALDTQMNTYSTASGTRVAFEGVDFNPSEGETYLKVDFLPARPTQRELIGANTRDRILGIYQITICTKKGLGTAAIDAQFEALVPYFNRGTGITYTNPNGEEILVECQNFALGRMMEDDAPVAYKILEVEWRSDIWVGTP